MRIVGGSARGRKLKAPQGTVARPTLDRVRESLFNILAVRVPGSAVLDLFAGSGALGLEALSRGAAGAVFVDSRAACVAVVRANLEVLGLSEGAEVVRSDAGSALLRFASAGRRFDVILMDPPYGEGHLGRCLPLAGAVLADGGVVVAEHDDRWEPPAAVGVLAHTRTAKYGSVFLSFYELGE